MSDNPEVDELKERIAPGSKGAVHAGPEATQTVEHNGIEHAQSYGLTRGQAPKTLTMAVRG